MSYYGRYRAGIRFAAMVEQLKQEVRPGMLFYIPKAWLMGMNHDGEDAKAFPGLAECRVVKAYPHCCHMERIRGDGKPQAVTLGYVTLLQFEMRYGSSRRWAG